MLASISVGPLNAKCDTRRDSIYFPEIKRRRFLILNSPSSGLASLSRARARIGRAKIFLCKSTRALNRTKSAFAQQYFEITNDSTIIW